MNMFMKSVSWTNVVLTPIVLALYWPNLDKLGASAFVLVPLWAAFYTASCLKSALSEEV